MFFSYVRGWTNEISPLLAPSGKTLPTSMASGLEIVLADVIKIVDFIHSHSKKHRIFSELCKDIWDDVMSLPYNTDVCRLSRGKVLKRVFHFKPNVHQFSRQLLDCKIVLLVRTQNRLNLSLQAKGYDVYAVVGKVQAFKEMLKLWQSKVVESGFSDFKCLQNFFPTSKWEIEDTNVEKKSINCARASEYYTTKFRSPFSKRCLFGWKLSLAEHTAPYS